LTLDHLLSLIAYVRTLPQIFLLSKEFPVRRDMEKWPPDPAALTCARYICNRYVAKDKPIAGPHRPGQ